MTDEEWDAGWVRTVGIRLGGEALDETDEDGNLVTDDTFLLLLNAHHDSLPFVLTASRSEHEWELVLDTSNPDPRPEPKRFAAGTPYELTGRSFALFCRIDS
jgi:glycogen operon protein